MYYAVSSEQDNLQSNGISIPLDNTEKRSNDSMAQKQQYFLFSQFVGTYKVWFGWLNPGELVIRQDLLSLVF